MAWSNPVADTTGTQALVPPLRAINVDLLGNAYTLVNGAIPVAQQQTSNVNGTLQNLAAANGNGTILALLGSASVILTVTMAAFTGTVNFEVSEDNVNWSALQVQQEGTNNIVTSASGTLATSVTLYEGSVAGLASLRARVSAFAAGTATVTAHAIPTTDAPRTMNVNVTGAGLPTIVQKTNAASTGSVATLAKAFGANNVAGNSIVVVAGCGNGTAMTVADTAGNTYVSAINAPNATTFEAAIFYAVNIAGGANTVTVTNGGSTASMALEIYEVAGLIAQSANVLDQTMSATGTSAAPSAANIAASVPNELAFMGIAVGTAAQASSVTAGTFWNLDSTQNTTTPAGLFSFGAFNQPLGSLLAVTPKATIAGSEPFALAAASFKPVALAVQGTVAIAGYNYTHLAGTGTTLIKTGPGVLHAIVVNTPVAGTLEADDALTNTTPVIAIQTVGTATAMPPFTVTYDVAFTIGLTIKITTGAMDATIVWK